jgi:hypothetical protein
MTREKKADYRWALNEMNNMYAELKVSIFVVIVTNMKRDLMNALWDVFSDVNHLLCLWHINKNVLVNCMKSFDTVETLKIFFFVWKLVIYVINFTEHHNNWINMHEKYNVTHFDCLNYLNIIYLRDYKRCFVRYFINQFLHFDITITFRNEREHAALKR